MLISPQEDSPVSLREPVTVDSQLLLLSVGSPLPLRLSRYLLVFGVTPRLITFQLVHEELALQWVVSNGPTREKAMSQAWFFFELMVKSMAEHLSVTALITDPRKKRFPPQFTDDCTALVVMITKEITDKCTAVSITCLPCTLMIDSNWQRSLSAVKERSFRANHSSRLMT